MVDYGFLLGMIGLVVVFSLAFLLLVDTKPGMFHRPYDVCLEHLPSSDFTVTTALFAYGPQYICTYETVPELDYQVCFRTLVKTQNHGLILEEDTCESEGE